MVEILHEYDDDGELVEIERETLTVQELLEAFEVAADRAFEGIIEDHDITETQRGDDKKLSIYADEKIYEVEIKVYDFETGRRIYDVE